MLSANIFKVNFGFKLNQAQVCVISGSGFKASPSSIGPKFTIFYKPDLTVNSVKTSAQAIAHCFTYCRE